ncbi:TerD family protein [Sphingomonas sp. 3-13AW]|uniref:TerD family protein n=1 Tax=Sphingomonas sp. 3-13AW TaxID=3050450 RepID=UPI003BB755FF
MSIQMTMGEKKPLSAIGVGQNFSIIVDHGAADLDIAIFSLDGNQRISDDRYSVLFSQPKTPGAEIRMSSPAQGSTRFDVELGRLPSNIERMVVTATHDTCPVSQALPLVVSIGDASFNVGRFLKDEKAVKLVEIYRHKGEWRLGAVAQGFNGGLAEMIRHFGGEVDGEPAAAPAPYPSTPPPPPPPPPKRVSLKKNESVSLAKKGSSFGEMFMNLNWSQPKGLFAKAVDLDLGCLFELEDGRCGVVQALGRSFGNYHQEPFIELSGDDRTGAIAAGETIRINGSQFQRIRRLAVFGLIYDGAPNWNATDGVITIKMPDQPEIEVRLTGGDNRKRLCGVALIENINGQMKITSLVSYHINQEDYANSQGFKMRWQAARKD